MHAPQVSYALETQTRPVFDRAPDESTVVHELAHQWFGDSVSLRRWQDIWLNEGFATYTEWLYAEHLGTRTAQQQFDEFCARPAGDDLWSLPVEYARGAMVLHKLRTAVGDRTFFAILRHWATANRYGHVTTAGFTAVATRMSHHDLTGLFHTWLSTDGKPAHA